jgi:hypothetical protein
VLRLGVMIVRRMIGLRRYKTPFLIFIAYVMKG